MKLAWHYDRDRKIWWAYSRERILVWKRRSYRFWWTSYAGKYKTSNTLRAAKRAAELVMEGRGK